MSKIKFIIKNFSAIFTLISYKSKFLIKDKVTILYDLVLNY